MKLTNEQKSHNIFQSIEHYQLEDLIEFSKSVKVLYVDKDTELRYDYYGIFKIFFYDIDLASDGQEGLELFYKNKYDLIITAVDLEKINGVEMISKIRQVSRNITILALSSQEKYFLELIRLGIDGYILSPIEIKQFVEIMKKVIDTLQNKQAIYEYRINLEKENQKLENRVKEEVEKNRKKELQLYEHVKLTAIGDMISNIAHQWRQPLSVISTATTGIQIKKDMNTLNDEYLDDSLEKINQNTQYLSSIIDLFSDFVRGDKDYKRIVLKDFLVKVSDIAKTSFINSNIELINMSKDGIDISIEIIPARLSQVILNILSNAKDILVQRGIDNPWVKIDLQLKKTKVIITVEDNAGGIKKEYISKIFEPYFTTKHKSIGTGLGLHISYRTVLESLNGNLYAENTQNGAKFFIELPIN